MQAWFAAHPLVSYIIIFVLIVFVYNKVFRVNQKLPLLKEILLYIMIALGSGMLLIFQVDKLPIIQSLLVAVALMLMVRIRYFVEDRRKKKAQTEAKAR
ncbi:YlaH-like family protein [Paenibacillus faecalis]|uniref:YlaH-like family protein n=1 Tax=Paenibacillus faecalis TaxID=2079532 RepID=UPI000D0E8D5D|nr:YlaH-like family protein [Paenibacillus faecalis]